MSEYKIDDYTLWQEVKENHNEDARQQLIIKFLPLVKYQVGRLKMIIPGFIDQNDLEGYGIIGLINAIERFDYQQGIKFNTYANKRIRGEIIDHLRKLDWLPHSLRRDGKRLRDLVDKITRKIGKKPSIDEIASTLNISQEKVNKLYYQLYSAQWVSLNCLIGDTQLIDLLPGDKIKQPEDLYQQKEREGLLVNAIDRLNEAERLVINLYYYEGLTQSEVAEVMGLSPARISQLHKKAVYRLRGFLSKKKKQLF